jgi:hypothetical protein
MISVLLAIAALFAGVAIVPAARRRPALMSGIDGFAIVTVGGILLLDLMPYSFARAGWWAIVAAAVGMAIPYLFERGHTTEQLQADNRMLGLAAAGLAVHAFLDGSALAAHGVRGGAEVDALAAGVLIHRLPMGLILGMLGTPGQSKLPWLAAALVAVGTVAGYLVGIDTLPHFGDVTMALFQALVAGSLAHVVYAHAPGGLTGDGPGGRRSLVIGMAIGAVTLLGIWGRGI